MANAKMASAPDDPLRRAALRRAAATASPPASIAARAGHCRDETPRSFLREAPRQAYGHPRTRPAGTAGRTRSRCSPAPHARCDPLWCRAQPSPSRLRRPARACTRIAPCDRDQTRSQARKAAFRYYRRRLHLRLHNARNTRRARVEHIHLKTGIIGQDGLSSARFMRRERLDARIAQKRIGVLYGVRIDPQLAQRFELPTGEIQRFGNLAGLVGIVACDDDSLHRMPFNLIPRDRMRRRYGQEGKSTRPAASIGLRNTRLPNVRNSSASSPVV